ncbi:MAG: hypothetical protein NWQ13_07995 [Glaciimonas sp.]|nr:hypothetical protein [Glaciimonas sp.]
MNTFSCTSAAKKIITSLLFASSLCFASSSFAQSYTCVMYVSIIDHTFEEDFNATSLEDAYQQANAKKGDAIVLNCFQS